MYKSVVYMDSLLLKTVLLLCVCV